MTMTVTAWPGRQPVEAAIPRPASTRLAATEYQRVADTVDALRPEEWARPTACADWDVRQLVAHVAGMAAFVTTALEMVRQMRIAQTNQREGQALVDAQTALQVNERQSRGPEALQAELRQAGSRAAKTRRRMPSVLRRLRLPGEQTVNGRPEKWSLGYLTEVILTRDAWMHRLDLARAVGRPPLLTSDHDGVLVSDVVAEWGRRHGRPYRLELTGPAGGSWSSGVNGEDIRMDAVEFCRVVSGRPGLNDGPASELLEVQVPF
jgi:uncharacterized protein (TIGR03083 family)